MNAARSQTVRRRQLGRELRRLREAARKSAQEVADWAGVSTSTLWKIERGSQAVKTGHVRLFAQLYGIGAPEADTLIRLAREANQRGWWAVYGDTVPDWVRAYLDLEQDASELWAYESGLICGLFQTPAYAEAITTAALPDADPDELARLVAFRTARQQRLFGDRPRACGSSSMRQYYAAWSAVQRSCANSWSTSPRWRTCRMSASWYSRSAQVHTPRSAQPSRCCGLPTPTPQT